MTTRTTRNPGRQVEPFHALDVLTQVTPPLIAGRVPYWRPRPPEVSRDVLVPEWNWSNPRGAYTEHGQPVERLVTLDAIAAYLAAASSVEVAHGRLEHTGKVEFRPTRAGYWLVDVHHWTHPGVWHPLGTGKLPSRVWVTTPTAQVLAALERDGFWPELTIRDSWTAPGVRLRAWAQHLARVRSEAMRAGDTTRYEAIKVGYSQAVALMLTGGKSLVHRPDWAQSIRAQHAANMHRRAMAIDSRGWCVFGSGTVDELVLSSGCLGAMAAAEERGYKVPVRVDPTGQTLGAFKIKRTRRVLTKGTR